MQTDRPIETAAQDKFDRAPFARRIADIVRQRSDAATLVIGIYGPWGDGKSSTLSLIKEALSTSGAVLQVDFNPWFFSSSTENLTRSFFLTLGEALENAGIFSREKIGALLKKYGGLVPKFGSIFQAAGHALSVTDLKVIRSKVEAILAKHKTTIVVFVDDIDRLDRKEIQTLFKLIRLSADFPYVIYILSFDDEIVAAALGEAYEGGDSEAGRRFLEKIVQAPLHLPKASKNILRQLAFENVDRILKTNAIDLTEQDAYAFANNFSLTFEPLLSTPRQVKLYYNAITFAVPALAAETNVVDLLLLEGIRTFLPKLYLAIRDNPDQFLRTQSGIGIKWSTDELVAEACESSGLTKDELATVRSRVLERLFPRTSAMGYGDEWDKIWAKEKRVCTSDYFARYFSYGVPSGDVADALIVKTLQAAAKNDLTALTEHFAAVAKQSAFPAFIRKLRLRELDIPTVAAPPLMRVISVSADALPREPSSMISDWTIGQAAILTSHLAQKLPVVERFATLKDAVIEATSFVYAVEILRWTHKYEEDGKQYGFLEEQELVDLTALIMRKIVEAANGQPLYRFLGSDTTKVLLPWAWYGDSQPLRKEIADSLKAEGADGAEELIKVATGKAWELQSGIPHISDVNRNVYNCISKLVDPEVVFGVLKARYGAKLDDPKFHHGDEVELGERLAMQFAFVHKKAKGE